MSFLNAFSESSGPKVTWVPLKVSHWRSNSLGNNLTWAPSWSQDIYNHYTPSFLKHYSSTTNLWYNLTNTPFPKVGRRGASFPSWGLPSSPFPQSCSACPAPCPSPQGGSLQDPSTHHSWLLSRSRQPPGDTSRVSAQVRAHFWSCRVKKARAFPWRYHKGLVSCTGERGGLLPASAHPSLKTGGHFMQCIVSLQG